jgi:hypothetical protein
MWCEVVVAVLKVLFGILLREHSKNTKGLSVKLVSVLIYEPRTGCLSNGGLPRRSNPLPTPRTKPFKITDLAYTTLSNAVGDPTAEISN